MGEALIAPDWIALDWGTTNLRAWAMDAADTPLAEAGSGDGMGTLSRDAFEPALKRLLAEWRLPPQACIVACGMVGARQGWTEAAYGRVPCPPLQMPFTRAPAADPGLDVWIVPGLAQAEPADVMRGEETQIAGLLAQDPGFEGIVCLPGSHTKWVEISEGRIERFRTAMTGEIFAAIADHTVLRHTLGEVWDEGAFVAAVADGMAAPQDLALRAFEMRANALLKDGEQAARARLSGLLIGAELQATRALWQDRPVALLGAPKLATHYASALESQGTTPQLRDAEACTLAGLTAAKHMI